jgi:hypothetical protein
MSHGLNHQGVRAKLWGFIPVIHNVLSNFGGPAGPGWMINTHATHPLI